MATGSDVGCHVHKRLTFPALSGMESFPPDNTVEVVLTQLFSTDTSHFHREVRYALCCMKADAVFKFRMFQLQFRVQVPQPRPLR